jgi:MmgE/PrpD C-terminal domain
VERRHKQPTGKGPAEWFTGDVWIDPVTQGQPPSTLSIGAVHFTPGARTAWHSRNGGQTLFVIEGRGMVRTRAGDTVEVGVGDVIYALSPGQVVRPAQGRHLLQQAIDILDRDAEQDPARAPAAPSASATRPRFKLENDSPLTCRDPSISSGAWSLAVPAAGGVQRAFGTDAKSLQVGFAVDAGIRAARLAAAGAQADPAAVDAWLGLVGGDPAAVDPSGPAVPDGLAVKLYPCCYALQRPISTLSGLAPALDPAVIQRIVLRTPEATVAPLIHHRPKSGLQGKFSLEYAAAAALLDEYPGFGSFTDAAVRRVAARRLTGLVETKLEPGGCWLLDGELEAEIHTSDGAVWRASQQFPPGSPARPASAAELQAKLADCVRGIDTDPATWTWENAPGILRRFLPGPPAVHERTETERGPAWIS